MGYLLQSSTIDKHNAHDSLELQLGAIGPAAGQEQTQTWIHKNITDSTIPLGWDNQIPNQIGVNAIYMHRLNYYPFHTGNENCSTGNKGCLVRVIPHLGTSIGNITNYANVGGLLLIGKSGSDLPALTIQPGFIQPIDSKNTWEYYIYIGFDYRYYASNLFVEGSGAAKHDIILTPGVYDVLTGLSLKPGFCDCKLSYKIINRSEEFISKDKSLEKSHRIGQINFDWYF